MWAPRGAVTAGKKGSERILAEIIVEDVNALGLAPLPGEAEEDAIERIRKQLARDVEKNSPLLNHASKRL